MSDNHDDNGKTGAFFLGMLVGMLLAGGAAGTFFITQSRHQRMRAEEALMEAQMAREEAEALRARAEAAARKAKE
jgi:hypothetical protein